MGEPIRVLQVVTHMNRGGLETMLMNYYRNIDRNKVQFDFLIQRNRFQNMRHIYSHVEKKLVNGCLENINFRL